MSYSVKNTNSQNSTRNVKHCRPISSMEGMYTCFLPRRLQVDTVNSLVTFAICEASPHWKPTKCLSQATEPILRGDVICTVQTGNLYSTSVRDHITFETLKTQNSFSWQTSHALQKQLRCSHVLRFYSQNYTILKYVKNKLPNVRLEKFAPAPTN